MPPLVHILCTLCVSTAIHTYIPICYIHWVRAIGKLGGCKKYVTTSIFKVSDSQVGFRLGAEAHHGVKLFLKENAQSRRNNPNFKILFIDCQTAFDLCEADFYSRSFFLKRLNILWQSSDPILVQLYFTDKPESLFVLMEMKRWMMLELD